MEISDSNYPHAMAQAYADLYAQGAKDLLAAQKANARRAQTGLADLRKALETFRQALDGFTAKGGGMVAHAARVSDPALAKAAVATGAAPGSYTFFVQQLASNHQLASGALAPVAVAGAGVLGIALADGTRLEVDLATADGNGDGQLSAQEIARAINQAAGGKLSASTLTVNGQQQLVFTSNVGGADGRITLDTIALGDPGLAAALDGATELAEARNAVFFLGGAGGTRIEQGSNSFTGVQGVTLEFTAANADVTLVVTRDDEATIASVRSFVDAYNALRNALAALTRAGDAAAGDPGGAFSGDAGVIALQRRLDDLLRQQFGGASLLALGISADRTGNLQLDSGRLLAALERDPEALASVLGDGKGGLTGAIGAYMDSWLSGHDGQLKKRQESVDSIQKALSKREQAISEQYDRLYQRYLAQFTQVQALNRQMEYTLSLIDSLLIDPGKK